MNKAEFVSRVAAETPTIQGCLRADGWRRVSAIAVALARDWPVAVARFGSFAVRGPVARQGGNS